MWDCTCMGLRPNALVKKKQKKNSCDNLTIVVIKSSPNEHVSIFKFQHSWSDWAFLDPLRHMHVTWIDSDLSVSMPRKRNKQNRLVAQTTIKFTTINQLRKLYITQIFSMKTDRRTEEKEREESWICKRPKNRVYGWSCHQKRVGRENRVGEIEKEDERKGRRRNKWRYHCSTETSENKISSLSREGQKRKLKLAGRTFL